MIYTSGVVGHSDQIARSIGTAVNNRAEVASAMGNMEPLTSVNQTPAKVHICAMA